jgi:hypothetical protein
VSLFLYLIFGCQGYPQRPLKSIHFFAREVCLKSIEPSYCLLVLEVTVTHLDPVCAFMRATQKYSPHFFAEIRVSTIVTGYTMHEANSAVKRHRMIYDRPIVIRAGLDKSISVTFILKPEGGSKHAAVRIEIDGWQNYRRDTLEGPNMKTPCPRGWGQLGARIDSVITVNITRLHNLFAIGLFNTADFGLNMVGGRTQRLVSFESILGRID